MIGDGLHKTNSAGQKLLVTVEVLHNKVQWVEDRSFGCCRVKDGKTRKSGRQPSLT